MAIGGVVVQFLVDSTKAVRGVGNMTAALGKVDDKADLAAGSLREVQREIDDTGQDARSSASQLETAERSLDSVADEAEEAARRMQTAGRQMGDGFEAGARDIDTAADGMRTNLGETGREAGAEFIGNMAEGIGSGQVNLNDVVSGTLGGLTNLAATMTGPVALAAAGVAAGVGLVFAAVKGEAERAQARFDELRGAMSDLENLSDETAESVIWDTWIAGAQETQGKVENVYEVLKNANVSAEEFTSALAGDPKAIDTVKGKLQGVEKEIEDAWADTGVLSTKQKDYLDNVGMVIGEIEAQDEAIGSVRRQWEATNGILDLSGKKTQNLADDTKDVIKQVEGVGYAWEQSTRNQSMTVTVNTKYPNGRPPSGYTTGGYSMGVGVSAASRAAPTTVTINVEGATDPYSTARTISRQLQQYAKIQGRRTHVTSPAW